MSNTVILKEAEEVRNIPIIFILGNGRSGTTLLQEMLNAHPNIVAPPESDFITLLYPRFGKIQRWKDQDILQFIEGLYFRRIFSLWLIDRKQLTEKLLSIKEIANYQLLCKMVIYEMHKDKKGVKILSDKNPGHSIFSKKLLKIYPEARFIHIIRDPRDNVNSHIKRFHKKNTYFLARRWVGFNTIIEKDKRKNPDKFFTIIYENMVSNPEETFIVLCKFLGITYDIAMMQNQFSEKLPAYKDFKFYERLKTEHQNLMMPVNTSNIGKWRVEMNAADIAITEKITSKFANRYYKYELKPTREDAGKISAIKLFLSIFQYYAWELFTKLRFENYALNKIYIKKKKHNNNK